MGNINYQNCPKKEILKLNRLDDMVEVLKVKDVVSPFQKIQMCMSI